VGRGWRAQGRFCYSGSWSLGCGRLRFRCCMYHGNIFESSYDGIFVTTGSQMPA
jgi:hypothetical protein